MKKIIFLFLVSPFFFLSCSDNESATESGNKDVTVEIECNSGYLPALAGQYIFTLDSEPVYNESDWDMAFQSPDSDEYQFILAKTDLSLANKLTLSFKQERVNFLLQCFYGPKDENTDADGMNIETRITVKVNGRVVNTETVIDDPLFKAIRYSE
jgi:hypothetical protein